MKSLYEIVYGNALMKYPVYITDLLDAFESNEVNNQD